MNPHAFAEKREKSGRAVVSGSALIDVADWHIARVYKPA
jgi:hypothetical protein